MKIIFCFIVIVFLESCSSFIYNEMERIGLEILNEPDRLLNLSYYYPDYYSDSLIYMRVKDKAYLRELRNYIIDEFNKIDADLDFSNVYTDSGYLKIYKRAGYKYKLNPDSIYSIFICKKNSCIDLMFLKSNEKYYLFNIGKNISTPHQYK